MRQKELTKLPLSLFSAAGHEVSFCVFCLPSETLTANLMSIEHHSYSP